METESKSKSKSSGPIYADTGYDVIWTDEFWRVIVNGRCVLYESSGHPSYIPWCAEVKRVFDAGVNVGRIIEQESNVEKVVMYRSRLGDLFETEEEECIAADRMESLGMLVYDSLDHLEYSYDTERISEDSVTQFVLENYEKIKEIMEAK